MDNTNISTNSKSLISTKRLVLCGLFAAILCISAYLSIPTPLPMAPKITMMNFMIFLIALLFPVTESFLIGLVWFLLGIVGLPVFIGGGSGIGYLIAPYGAYTWAFPIVLVVLPLIRGKKYNRVWYTICGIIGVLIIDLIGMFWLKSSMGYDLKTAFLTGFIPFIPLDLVKAVVVAQIIPAFKRIVE
ncbi:biotin transporter BioY [Pseudobutyrivibrio sp.]|jgi:biotin transport system substrate-specific component|uniref:biotin transporter BioY n=1 Tax=Pseudobutyrivibrio sp. TaxID=2014367 RepID=UPI0025D8993E|nr:biotin transporter BioY [Pseudobutyrivibrio sp.]